MRSLTGRHGPGPDLFTQMETMMGATMGATAAMPRFSGAAAAMPRISSMRPMRAPLNPTIPDNEMEVEIFLVKGGVGMPESVQLGLGVKAMDPRAAASLLRGKEDLCGDDLEAYLASSLAHWLSECKLDGDGRPYAEVKDTDPITRRRFTRSQIKAIHAFAKSDGGTATGQTTSSRRR